MTVEGSEILNEDSTRRLSIEGQLRNGPLIHACEVFVGHEIGFVSSRQFPCPPFDQQLMTAALRKRFDSLCDPLESG